MTLDDLYDEIPKEVRDAAKLFSQGDLLERIPASYLLVGRHAVTTNAREPQDDAELSIYELEDAFELAVITTQTCDIVEEDSAVAKKPWVQVAPVYRYDGLDDRHKADVEAYNIPDLARLTAPRFQGGFYVADLRLSIPVEKSVLVGRDVLPGFVDDASAVRFGDHCAAYINRAALPGIIHELVVKHLNSYFARHAEYGPTLKACNVHDLRLNLNLDGPEPIVRVVVLTKDLTLPNVAAIEKIFEAWYDAAVMAANQKKKAINFLMPRVTSLAQMSAEEYIRTVAVRTARILPVN